MGALLKRDRVVAVGTHCGTTAVALLLRVEASRNVAVGQRDERGAPRLGDVVHEQHVRWMQQPRGVPATLQMRMGALARRHVLLMVLLDPRRHVSARRQVSAQVGVVALVVPRAVRKLGRERDEPALRTARAAGSAPSPLGLLVGAAPHDGPRAADVGLAVGRAAGELRRSAVARAPVARAPVAGEAHPHSELRARRGGKHALNHDEFRFIMDD